MSKMQPLIDWIAGERQNMLKHVRAWSDINTHSHNAIGLAELSKKIACSFQALHAEASTVDVPAAIEIQFDGKEKHQFISPILTFQKRKEASRQALFVCHMDTVFPIDSSFQKCELESDEILRGPGVCDAKGGIAIILQTLLAFEQSQYASGIGWKVILNSDEELGSPGSADYLSLEAKKFDLGLVYEPCLPDGSLVSSRKGSGNMSLVVRGAAAHAGRDHHLGINAIDSMANCIKQISALSHQRKDLTVNFGCVRGGDAVNIVPDLAVAKFNVRVLDPSDEAFCMQAIKTIIKEREAQDGAKIILHGNFTAPCKPITPKVSQLINVIKNYGEILNMDIKHQATGGVCDGNRLQAAGLATIDTLGAKGNYIHSHQEYLDIPSLTQRTQLSFMLLDGWAKEEWSVHGHE
ncbi:MAG: glutamate carboxypeptidase [Candidatus Omnitrophota bacterium]|jgi:glutamate carboxypeptidase